GVFCNGRAAGLLLLGPEFEGKRRLLSVFVTPAQRGKGLAKRLLLAAEANARDAGITTLFALHSDRSLGIFRFERLLQSCGWDAPEFFSYRLSGTARWVERAALEWGGFLAHQEKSGVSVRFLADLAAADVLDMLSGPASQVPEPDCEFVVDQKLLDGSEAALSLLIFYKEKIVGWICAQPGIEQGGYYYKSGYVLPPYQRRGVLLYGLYAVCRKQFELFGPETKTSFETVRPRMKQLMEQKISAFADWTDTQYKSSKTLQP
ncbi:MAG: N-acetyltransferase family protein, partial [Burkholderiales bacterium]